MGRNDADLFLDWAADEFVAAGRARGADQRHAHRRQAELFCDIFHALNRSPTPRPTRKPQALIGSLLDKAFSPTSER